MRKKLLSVLLALSMVLALTPTAVWAAGEGTDTDTPPNADGGTTAPVELSFNTLETLPSIVDDGVITLAGLGEFDFSDSVQDKTLSVTGKAYYISGWEKFNTTVPEEQSGYYLPIQISLPGDLSDYGKVTITGAGDVNPKVIEGFTQEDHGVELVIRLDDLTDHQFTVQYNADPAYTIDCSQVVLMEHLSFAITEDNVDLLGKHTSDLYTAPSTGEPISVDKVIGTDDTIAVVVKGAANKIENWTDFSSIPEEQSGHYVPLKLTPSAEGCTVRVKGSKDISFDWPAGGDTLVMRLDDLREKNYRFTVEISKDGREGTTYTVDCSALMSPSTPSEPQSFTVTFNKQDGSSNTEQSVTSGEKIIKPADPTRTGYTFGGWYKNEACTEPWNFDTDTVTKNLTLYAKWTREETVTGYTITFNGNGGSVTPSTAKTGANGKLSSLPTPTRDGYQFEGWYTESTGGTKVSTATEFTRNTTIYAHWTKADETKDEFTVTFNSQGGSEVEKQTVKSGEKAKKPGDPKRNGYEFGGWYKEKDCKNEWDFDTKITADTELFAKWTEIKDPDGPGEEEKDEYSISVQSGIRHGRIYVTHQHARPGEWVTITVSPDTDYTLDWIRVERSNGYRLYLDQDGRKYSFVMPYSDVTIDAGFDLRSVYTSYTYYQPVETASSPAASTPVFPQSTWRPVAIMRDVPTNSWAYPSAQWAYQNGYLDTAADGSFRLNAPVSHRQMWKIMAQWLNAPAMDDRELTNWAMQNGAARGNHAAGSMTRQDVVTYLYQCCFLMGGDVSASGNLSQYSDSRLLTSAASRNAWTWAVSKGIISGTSDGYLNPSGTVNRGEFAAILMRLCQNVTK